MREIIILFPSRVQLLFPFMDEQLCLPFDKVPWFATEAMFERCWQTILKMPGFVEVMKRLEEV